LEQTLQGVAHKLHSKRIRIRLDRRKMFFMLGHCDFASADEIQEFLCVWMAETLKGPR